MLDLVRSSSRPDLILALFAKVLAQESVDSAALTLTTTLVDGFRFNRVSLGLSYQDELRLTGAPEVSGEGRSAAVLAAMNEALEQSTSIATPSPKSAQGPVTLAHQALARTEGGAVATVPLSVHGKVVGAVTFQRDAPGVIGLEELTELEHLLGLVTPVFQLKMEKERSLRRHCRDALAASVARVRHPEARGLKRGLVIAALAAAFMLCVPIADRVSATARVEGESQRLVVAPADGYLGAAHVRAGDEVRAGQLLAELHDQELLLERERRLSEVNRGETAYAGAMSRSDSAAAAVHLAERAEAQSYLDLVDEEIRRAAIVSPIDGLVIRGDLSQAIGSPVKQGDTLFLLAAAGGYRVIVEVDERDVAKIAVGQPGSLSLSALPWDTLALIVTRITPVAATSPGRNVFEVETRLTEVNPALRPGLHGRASITIGRLPLAWSWMRALAARLSLLAWRVTP